MAGDAVREALLAAATAVENARMPDGDGLGVLLHLSGQIDGGQPLADQLQAVERLCQGIARDAIAAFLRALPEGYVEIERECDGICYPQQLGMTDQHAKLLAAAVSRAGGDE